MKTKQIVRNLRPTELNVHLKYVCPACSVEHWLSLEEAKTKGYLIVCDCDSVLKVKLVDSLKVKFYKKETGTKIAKSEKVEETSKIDVDLLSKCCTILVGYGYDKSEIEKLITKTYQSNPTTDIKTLVKNTLMNIGDING
jgi:hypothetical protein